MQIVTGHKTTIFKPEEDLGDGQRIAGSGQVTRFAMEELTQKTFDMWFKYVGEMGLKAKELTKLSAETHTAMEGFVNGLAKHALNTECKVFVVYSFLDMDALSWDNYAHKRDNIQMAMTVCSDKNDSFPAVTHMGIFRSPLLALDKKKYQGKTSRGIALEMHCFAAKAFTTLRPVCKPTLMITAPMPIMSKLLGSLSNDISHNQESVQGGTQSVKFTYKQQKHVWNSENHRWIFDLAFNRKHGLKTSFTDFQALQGLHQEIGLKIVNVAG